MAHAVHHLLDVRKIIVAEIAIVQILRWPVIFPTHLYQDLFLLRLFLNIFLEGDLVVLDRVDVLWSVLLRSELDEADNAYQDEEDHDYGKDDIASPATLLSRSFL